MSDVLAVVEHRRGELRPVSLELLSAGSEIAEDLGGEFHVAVLGGPVEKYAERLNREGVDCIHTVANGSEFNHDVYVETVGALCEDLAPDVLLAPHTVNGLDYVPAVAVDREMSLVTDVMEVEIEDGEDDEDDEADQHLVATRGFFESKVRAPVTVDEWPVALTVRPGEWPSADGVEDVEVRPFDYSVSAESIGSTVEGYEAAGKSDVDITAADFLIGVGRGVESKADLSLIEELASVTDATIGASRPLVDRGWFESGRQIGQSGKTVSPDVYLAVGISGAIQHVSGIKNADRIVAVNTDPHAPIFDLADLAIVGDLYDVIPALIEKLR